MGIRRLLSAETDGRLPYKTFDAQYWGVPPTSSAESTLSSILVENVHPKYLFGKREGLLWHTSQGAEKRGKALPKILRIALGTADRTVGIVPVYSVENHPTDSRVKIDPNGAVQGDTNKPYGNRG